MQAKCPKCDGTAFRMLPESVNVTEVECLTCGHVASFVSTVAPQARRGRPPQHHAADGE
jgi:Zn ribbon nucleic-acid-binding protein